MDSTSTTPKPTEAAGAPGDKETWRMKATDEDLLLSNLFVTMLQRLGVETETFANSTGCISEG